MPEIVAVRMEVMLHDSEKPGWGRGTSGMLFITDRRLAFSKLKQKKAFLRYRYEECPEDIDDALKNEGSFEVPINQVIEAMPDTVLKTPYMRVRYSTGAGEKVFSFILSMSWTSGGISTSAITYYRILSEVIKQAKNGTLTATVPMTDNNVKTPEMVDFIKKLKLVRDSSGS